MPSAVDDLDLPRDDHLDLDLRIQRFREPRRREVSSGSGVVSANKVCFERDLLDHYRLVFEKQRSAKP